MDDKEIYKTFVFPKPDIAYGKGFDPKEYIQALLGFWLGFERPDIKEYAEKLYDGGCDALDFQTFRHDLLTYFTDEDLQEMNFQKDDSKKIMKILAAHRNYTPQEYEARRKRVDALLSTTSKAYYAIKPNPSGVGVQWTAWVQGSPHHKKSLCTSTPSHSSVKLRSAPSEAHVKAILQRCQKSDIPLTFQMQSLG